MTNTDDLLYSINEAGHLAEQLLSALDRITAHGQEDVEEAATHQETRRAAEVLRERLLDLIDEDSPAGLITAAWA